MTFDFVWFSVQPFAGITLSRAMVFITFSFSHDFGHQDRYNIVWHKFARGAAVVLYVIQITNIRLS